MSNSTQQAPTAGQPIPASADFTVAWDDPRDAKVTWMLNPKYNGPMPLLTHAFVAAFLVGGVAGFEQAGLPLSLRVARFNTYEYIGMVPKGAPPEAVMKAMGLLNRAAPGVFKMMMGKVGAGMSKQQEAALNPIIEKFETYWLDEVLPEIKQHIAYFESCDLRGLSLDQLRACLAQYGQRLNDAFTLGEPSWIEDPAPAIQNLQAYLTQPEPRPEMEPATLAVGREKAVAEARLRLAGYPQPVVTRFETLLKAAQVAVVVLEDHNCWIDQRLFYHIRRLILGFGQRLVQAGMLEAANDVFYLTQEELQNSRDVPMKRLVQERKAEMERFSRATPPSMLGTPPAFELEDGGPMMRAMFKSGVPLSNTGPGDAHKVKGIAGSAGVVRGTARVILSLAESGKLQPGDVLVAQSTMPPWTPLFATASAVVTDIGGVFLTALSSPASMASRRWSAQAMRPPPSKTGNCWKWMEMRVQCG